MRPDDTVLTAGLKGCRFAMTESKRPPVSSFRPSYGENGNRHSDGHSPPPPNGIESSHDERAYASATARIVSSPRAATSRGSCPHNASLNNSSDSQLR